jgi:hypothetical protein
VSELFHPDGAPVMAEHDGIVEAQVEADGSLRLKQEAYGWLPWRRTVAFYPARTWLRVAFSHDGTCVVSARAGVPQRPEQTMTGAGWIKPVQPPRDEDRPGGRR